MRVKLSSHFIREQKHYSDSDLKKIFQTCDDDDLKRIITRLKEVNALKVYSKKHELSDLNALEYDPEDISVEDNQRRYIFPFVGVISITRNNTAYILKCYPKYIRTPVSDGNTLNEKIKNIFSVLKRYNSQYESINSDISKYTEKSYNLLPLILFLLKDYFENGLYTNIVKTLEVNGSGEINWDKTINGTMAIMSGGRPIYPELITKKDLNNTNDYFRRLHSCIITLCSRDLEDTGLLDLFDYPKVDISDENLDTFGDEKYIKDKLRKELNVVFDTRKRILLQKMYDYIEGDSRLTEDNCCTLYGTSSFNLVWERICAEVLNDQLNENLSKVNLPEYIKKEFKNYKTLLDIIEKPKWIDNTSNSVAEAEKTLKPDIVSTEKVSIQNSGNNYRFLIFDAKYYIIKWDTIDDKFRVHGQPGVGDLTKQYLYQLAFKNLLSKIENSIVKNCFLLPSDGDNVEKAGVAYMEMLDNIDFGNNRKMERIQLRLLPAKIMYDKYLNGDKLKHEVLLLD